MRQADVIKSVDGEIKKQPLDKCLWLYDDVSAPTAQTASILAIAAIAAAGDAR